MDMESRYSGKEPTLWQSLSIKPNIRDDEVRVISSNEAATRYFRKFLQRCHDNLLDHDLDGEG